MEDNRKILLASIMAAVLIMGGLAASVSAQDSKANESEEDYKNLLMTIDGSIGSSRFGKDPSSGLTSARDQYKILVGENNTDNEILNTFNNLIAQGKEVEWESIQELRGQVKKDLDIRLPFHFEYSVFIIVGISLVLSLGVTLINRQVVDWEKVNAAKARMQEWQKEFREAQRKGGKKKLQKLKLRQSDLMKEQKEVMGATMKPMIFYIIPYILLWWALDSLYGGWVVAWIPFKFPWPDLGIRLFSGSFVSLGFLGWYLLSYFGFAQIWRKFLIPS